MVASLILRLNYEEPQCMQFTDIMAQYSSPNHPKVGITEKKNKKQ